MLDWCKKTLTRYKNGLFTGSVVTTGVVALGYACKQKLSSWQQEHMEQLLKTSHIEQHYFQHYQNMSTSLTGYFEKLRERVSELCETDSTLQMLKSGGVSKLAGWELLRKQVLTKLLLSLYSSTLLTLFLSVQLTVVKARILLTMSSGEGCEDVNQTTRRYLSKISLLLNHSVPELMTICEEEVDRVFGDYGLDTAMSLCDLRILLEEIAVRQKMELVRLCRMDLENDIMDTQLKEVILVSLDICESQDFSNTYKTLASHALSYYLVQIVKLVPQDPIVLAKLLSLLNKVPGRILSSEKEEYISHLLDCKELKALCCSVYCGLTDT